MFVSETDWNGPILRRVWNIECKIEKFVLKGLRSKLFSSIKISPSKIFPTYIKGNIIFQKWKKKKKKLLKLRYNPLKTSLTIIIDRWQHQLTFKNQESKAI